MALVDTATVVVVLPRTLVALQQRLHDVRTQMQMGMGGLQRDLWLVGLQLRTGVVAIE